MSHPALGPWRGCGPSDDLPTCKPRCGAFHAQLIARGAWNPRSVNQCHWWDVVKGDYPMSVISTGMGSAASSLGKAAGSESSSDEVLIRRIARGDQLAMSAVLQASRCPLSLA